MSDQVVDCSEGIGHCREGGGQSRPWHPLAAGRQLLSFPQRDAAPSTPRSSRCCFVIYEVLPMSLSPTLDTQDCSKRALSRNREKVQLIPSLACCRFEREIKTEASRFCIHINRAKLPRIWCRAELGAFLVPAGHECITRTGKFKSLLLFQWIERHALSPAVS